MPDSLETNLGFFIERLNSSVYEIKPEHRDYLAQAQEIFEDIIILKNGITTLVGARIYEY